jgi:hypothetical protein
MRHHLIDSAENWKYRPLAENCIKKLRATGLSYASQSFEVDGVSISARIAGEHEFIRIGGGGYAYMESGQLSWTFPGIGNPERLDSAKWHFLNIPTTDNYLGEISASPVKDRGRQKNDPLLSEGMDSLAIGYPKAKTSDPDKIAKDADMMERYGEATVMKKLAVGLFPSSLFSGKMRLFMQSLYGAPELEKDSALLVDVYAASAVLKYRRKTDVLQLGFFAHSSQGIFTTARGDFFLVSITASEFKTYVVTTYKITSSSQFVGIYQSKIKEGFAAGEREKLEAYIFANSAIDLKNPKVVRTFISDSGMALAYGWKWSEDGSQARIVLHKTIGTPGSFRWSSTTITLDITENAVDGGTGITAVENVVINGEWTDGWGAYNIFSPEYETDYAPLMLISMAVDPINVKPAFAFTDIPIYGYFKGNSWFGISVSRFIPTGFPKYKQTVSGNVIFNGGLIPTDNPLPRVFQYGLVKANEGMTWEGHDLVSSVNMTLQVGDEAYIGTSDYGLHQYLTRTVSGAGSIDNTVDFASGTLPGGPFTGPTPPGYNGDPNGGANNGGYLAMVEVVLREEAFTGLVNSSWVLVIPGGDCEAVCVATLKNTDQTSAAITTTSGTGVGGFDGFTPWAHPWQTNSWYGIAAGTTVTTTEPPTSYETSVFLSNSVLSNAAGTPRMSYYGLFTVSQSYPQWDPGMYTYTSAGGRYVMSEGVKHPASVDFGHRFVGWA